MRKIEYREQRVQVIKGQLENGEHREDVYDVAWSSPIWYRPQDPSPGSD